MIYNQALDNEDTDWEDKTTVLQVRHDVLGFYVLSDEEAETEDKGNPSAGFDGRPHYASEADAWKALEEANA